MTRTKPSCDRLVREAIRDLRTSTIELSDNLAGLEPDWLVGRLLARRGVRNVDYLSGAGGGRLNLEFDADELNRAELVDLLHLFGVRVRPVALVV